MALKRSVELKSAEKSERTASSSCSERNRGATKDEFNEKTIKSLPNESRGEQECARDRLIIIRSGACDAPLLAEWPNRRRSEIMHALSSASSILNSCQVFPAGKVCILQSSPRTGALKQCKARGVNY